MSRVIISFCLISVIALYSLSAILILRTERTELIGIIDDITMYDENGDSEKATAAAANLSKKWVDYERIMSVLVHENKLNSIGASVAKIQPFLDTDSDELEAELQSVRLQLVILYRSELPLWYNVL